LASAIQLVAPLGYEDDQGFHYGAPEIASRREFRQGDRQIFLNASWLIVALCLLPGGLLCAHNSPSSAVLLDFQGNGVAAELTLPLSELELSFKQPLVTEPANALAKNNSALKEYIHAHVNPKTEDGRAWDVVVRDLKLQTNQTPFDLVAQVWMTPPNGASTRRFNFDYSVINHEVMSHNAYVSVRSDWDTAVFSNQPEPLGNIHFTVTSLEIDRSRGSWWQGFRSVVDLGVQHIAEGTDHLMFLLVLLLPAPLAVAGKGWGEFGGLKRSVVRLLKIVTAFTLGHSLTLLIGTIGLVRLPDRLVEILIALSILISAIHAMRPWFAGREAFIAGGFGLIHGLAFASSISGFGFSPWHMVSMVLGFNLGIEMMQLVVVAVTIPWLILLSRTSGYTPFRIVGATFGALAALGWIVERAWSVPNPVEPLIGTLVAHPWWLVGTLAATALFATTAQALIHFLLPISKGTVAD